MVSINLERDCIKDSGYNTVNHMDKQDTDIISMKEENSEVVHAGDMVSFIEEIKKVDPEETLSEIIYASDDLYEDIEEYVLEVEVYDQSSAVSKSIVGLEQTLEAISEDKHQINEEAEVEVLISDGEIGGMIVERFEVGKLFIDELKMESGNGFNDCVEVSNKINGYIITDLDEEANTNRISQYYGVASEETCSKTLNIGVSNLSISDDFPDKSIVEKLRERGSSRILQGNNSHRSIDDEESSPFEEARGVRKKPLRISPRRGSKLRLSSSMTSVG